MVGAKRTTVEPKETTPTTETKTKYCPNCKKEVTAPGAVFIPKEDDVKKYLASDLDRDGNPIVKAKDYAFERFEVSRDIRCYWCGTKLEEIVKSEEDDIPPIPGF